MQKRRNIFPVCLLLLFSFTSIFPINTMAATLSQIYVDTSNINGPWDGTSGHPFLHIQDGIDAVIENGTVYVSNGTYCEQLTINKILNLVGNEKGNTTIDICGGEDGIHISANHVNISGFTIQNAGWNGAEIEIFSDCNNISKNKIKGGPTGIKLSGSSYNKISENIFN